MKLRMSVLFAVFGVTVLPGSSFVSIANALCDDVTEYVETWSDPEGYPENGTVRVYARGVAEAGEGPCDLTVRTYFEAPDDTELNSSYGYGPYIAQSIVTLYLDDTSPEGEYQAKTEAWSGQVHYGCSFENVQISWNTAHYQLNSQDSEACYFWACDTSAACSQGRTPRSAFPPNGICPSFANIRTLVVWIPPVPLRSCWTITAIPIASCSP